MIIKLYIGTDKLDLFKDENIEVNSSIADVSDITKNTTEYTKSFTVPASTTNNQIFKHYYNADLTGDAIFDARIKVDGSIELDGVPFKLGKYRLSKVSVKKGVPYSYTINFWGNLVNIKDALKKDELSDLDLSAYNHAYNSSNVRKGLTSSLFSGDLIYNLFTKKQLYFNADGSDSTQTASLSNIAFGGGTGSGVIWSDLRPSIRLIRVIEAIESQYNLTFSRDFFGRSEFTELFMWLNNDSDNNIGGEETIIDFDSGDSTNVNFATNIGTYTAFRGLVWWGLYLVITPSAGYETVDYTVTHYVDDEIQGEITKEGEFTWYNTLLSPDGETIYNTYFTVKSTQEFKFTTLFDQRRNLVPFGFTTFRTFSSEQTLLSEVEIIKNVPKLRSIDLLKGLFNASKLVVIPQSDGVIYVNTLKDYYAEGSLKNITRYVDFEQYDVSRGKLLNEINFLFTEPSTILNIQFEKNTNIAYGDEETILNDEDGEILDGEALEFTLPFEQFVYERLNDLNDNAQTNVQYAAIVDEDLNGVNPKAHIFYNINQTIGTKTVGFIDDIDVKSNLGTTINTASHVNAFEEQAYSFLFGSEFSTWDGTKINNTLFSNYHQDYIGSIFNVKRRTFKYSANLPLRVLLELELNDVVEIKSTYYRIDNYNLNLLTGKADFTLINSFDNTVVGFYPDRTDIITDFPAQQQSIYVVNLTTFTSVKIDVGSGTGWVTVSSSGNNIFFDLTENNTGVPRDVLIDIINDDTLQEFQMYIRQTPDRLTLDNNVATWDNNIITWDNN